MPTRAHALLAAFALIAAPVGGTQPLSHTDDLTFDGVPDTVEIVVQDDAEPATSEVLIIDGVTGETVHTIRPPANRTVSDAAIAADWTGDGVAEVLVATPHSGRWGGFGLVTIYDGVTFEPLHRIEGGISDIFGLEIVELPDADADGWDEIAISSHFIDNDLNVWRELLPLRRGLFGVIPIAPVAPTLVLQGADIDDSGVVDLIDIAAIIEQIGCDDPDIDLDADGIVTPTDALVAAQAAQGGPPSTPNGRLLFWIPDADPDLANTGEAVLNRTGGGGGGLGGGGGGGGGGQGDGGGGGGGGDDDDDGGGGGGGGEDDDDDGSNNNNDDDEEENDTKIPCVFDNPDRWVDREDGCSLLLFGSSLGKYSAIYPGNGPTLLIFGANTSGSAEAISWSVSGADVEDIFYENSYGMSFCFVSVTDPGTVTVSATSSTACGSLSVQGKTKAIELDLDIDADNNDGLDEPARDEDEEELEFAHRPIDDTPGKVALTNTFDNDHDGLPGYIDGINMFDVDTITADDEGGHDMLVPLILDVNGPVCPEVSIKFSYAAARPPIGLADELAGLERPYDDTERVRLWRKRGPSRDPRSILDGGDFVPPNEWIPLATLGLTELDSTGMARPAPDTTLWVEPIMPSQDVADVQISAKLSLGVEGSMQARDAVRMTVTEVVLLGRDGPDDTFDPVVGPVTSDIIDDNFDGIPDEGSLVMTYRMEILDPRSSGFEGVTAEGQQLQLWRSGTSGWTTPEFMVLEPGAVPPAGIGAWIYHQPGTGYEFEYNPAWEYSAEWQPEIELEPYKIKMANTILDVTHEYDFETWKPNNFGTGIHNPGQFGLELHQKISHRLSTDEEWLVNVYADHNTGRIVSINGSPSGDPAGLTQVDTVALQGGFRPAVGDTWDSSRMEIIELKFSLRGERIPNDPNTSTGLGQADRLTILNGGRYPTTFGSPVSWSDKYGKLIYNERVGMKFQLMKSIKSKKLKSILGKLSKATFVGSMAFTVHALMNNHVYAHELDIIESKIINYVREDDPYWRPLLGVELVQAITGYMRNYSDGPWLDVIDANSLYLIYWIELEAEGE